jgi:vacuolar protein sorting-associated protein 54
MYRSILARLRLAQAIGPDLSAILSAAAQLSALRIRSLVPSTEVHEFDEPTPLGIDETDVLASACELGNLRASKILAVRGEQHAGLGIDNYVELFKENWAFVLATESLAGRMIASLRGVTASQVSSLVLIG